MTQTDYEYYVNNELDEYSGKWVAIKDQKVIASDQDFDKVVKEVTKKYKLADVFLTHIPEKEIALAYANI